MIMRQSFYLKIAPVIILAGFSVSFPGDVKALGLDSLLSSGGGDPVRIISDISEPARTTAIRTTLIAGTSAKTSEDLYELVLKELVKDSGSWNLAKQLQQQLTSEMLKYLGGQQQGQNGQVPFVQNYAEYRQGVADVVAGEYLFDDKAGDAAGQCSPQSSHKVRVAIFNTLTKARNDALNGGALSCGGSSGSNPTDYDSSLHRLLGDFAKCRDELCRVFQGTREAYERIANAEENELLAINNARGFIPQRVCDEVEDADGRVRRRCEIVNPPSLAADAAAFQLVELPGLSLLNIDEYDEVVSNLMSNLTNQAINGLTGVLGLSGNSKYGQNIFGQNGNLSYAEALAKDDLSQYQSGGLINPVAEALKNEREYNLIQTQILATIKGLEDKLAANTEQFPRCFDMELTADLKKTKEDSTSNLTISSTTLAVLINLNQQYATSTNTVAKNAALTTFTQLKNQGLFRTAYQNQELRLTFIELTFAAWVDRFKYDMALERRRCGGSFDYEGVISPATTTPSV